jgi:hypothetical protein
METVLTPETISNGLQKLEPKQIPGIVIAIAKRRKKNPKTFPLAFSGNLSYAGYCDKIADTLSKPENGEILRNVVNLHASIFGTLSQVDTK